MQMTASTVDGIDPDEGLDFCLRVRRATANVLGDSLVGRKIASLYDRHDSARRLLLEDRGNGLPVVGAVGPAGQGKSTIVRWLTAQTRVKLDSNEQGSAQRADSKMVWYGPNPPAYFDSLFEEYRHCNQSEMEPIGLPYLLLDSPSCNDDRLKTRELASKSLALSSVLLLVIRADQIRSEVITFVTQVSEGSVLVPVINAIRHREDALIDDVNSLVARLNEIAPDSVVTDPVLIDDYEIANRSQSVIGTTAAADIAQRVEEAIGGQWEDEKRRYARLSSLDQRFRRSLHAVLSEQLPGLTSAVTRLNQESTRIPREIAESLVGRGGPLQAAIRSRLRLALLTETAAYWFPYRSMIALLNLTHGAWDRVLLSLSGSLPSLIGAMWTSASGHKLDHEAVDEVRRGLQRRGEVAVQERLGPLANQFRRELADLHVASEASRLAGFQRHEATVAKLSGIETLQGESQRIFDDEVERFAFSRWRAMTLGFVGTVIFWGLLSAPIITLYSEYLSASLGVFHAMHPDNHFSIGFETNPFPSPDAAMLFTSLALSLLPTAVFAMFVLSSSQGHRRVRIVEQTIRTRHHESIEALQRSGVLQLHWDDPLLSDAEFLLTAGSGEPERK